MRLIDTSTGEIIADITSNHSMSIDDILSLMQYTIDNDTGQIVDGNKPLNAYYDNLIIEMG